MKKILWFLFGFALAAGLGKVLWNTWETTRFFQTNGRTASLTIGKKYNDSRWSTPLPIKQLHTYTAVMAPKHEVLVESDQTMKENQEYSVRFLLRDLATEGRKMSLRPLGGSLRLKSEADGTPGKTGGGREAFSDALTDLMGPMGDGFNEPARPTTQAQAPATPSREKPTVPFMIAGAKDSTLTVIWNNSTVGEWLIVIFWVLGTKLILLHAWNTPFLASRPVGSERKDFIHPSMRRIDPDATAPTAKITYVPKSRPAPPPDPGVGQ